jgi:heme-degrading monooxygenase HmoA
MPAVHVDFANHPNLRFRIDSFSVPAAARGEFDATMKRNLVFIEKLPGFHGHYVFEKTSGPTTFDVVTVAVWENDEALERAGVEVREYYRKIDFDPRTAIARWGAKGELGNFRALLDASEPPEKRP